MQGMFSLQFNQMGSFRSIDSSGTTFDVAADLQKQFAMKAAQQSRRKYKKPTGKPKRPLSAYNIFFKAERAKLVDANKKVGFSNMAKQISTLWNALDEEGRKTYVAAAEIEQKKYRAAVKEWKLQNKVEIDFSTGMSSFLPMMSTPGDPIVLQRLMLEKQLVEQQIMIQQMENALNFSDGPRRSSMPPDHAPSQEQINSERRASMPTQISPSHTASASSHQSVDLTHDTYDSTDDSTLDDETADFLINMPIMDFGKDNDESKGVPSSVVLPLNGRRSSMPSILASRKVDWDVNPLPLPPRRVSMYDSPSDDMKEMQSIFSMLDDDDYEVPIRYSSRSSAA